jgi:hypothetical protein
MLIDRHYFQYTANVPWPKMLSEQLDWISGINCVEQWLNSYIGSHYIRWAWHDSEFSYHIGVAFKLDSDRSLFVLTWA